MGNGYNIIRNLINLGNNKTGANDTKLTDVVIRLLEGYGIGEGIVPSGTKDIDSNGIHDVRDYSSANVHVTPSLEETTLTPSESTQTILPNSGKDGFSKIILNAISRTYIGSAIVRKSAQTYTPTKSVQNIESGQYLSGTQTINPIPDEYIVPNGTKNITSNGTHNVAEYENVEISISGNAPRLQTKTINPTESSQIVNPDSNYDGLSSVSVGAISKTYVGSDVPKKNAQTYTPTKSTQTIASGQYLSGVQTIAPIPDAYVIPSGNKSITSNGTHTVAGFESVTIDVPTSGGSGGTNYEDGRSIYYTGRI